MNEITTFSNSINNIEYSRDLSYLLNFWHTTKLNKEYEFIKRNGIHPSVISVEKKGLLDFSVKEGNSIQTNFYTVFRIFIENVFNKEYKTSKSKNREEWSLSFKDELDGLDSSIYLIMYYSNDNDLTSEIIYHQSYRGYIKSSRAPLLIKIKKQDQLHSKKIIESLKEFESHASEHVDKRIIDKSNLLLSKLSKYLNLEEKLKEEDKPKKASASFTIPRAVPHAGLNQLLPIYSQLNSMITGMDNRAKFSFILNYAQQQTNEVINSITNSEINYEEFMRLTQNMTA